MVENYILIAMVIITYIIIYIIPLKNKNKIFLITVFLEFFVILILRTPISDMEVYIKYFNRIANLNFSELIKIDWELGYVIFNKLITLITINERIFILITAIIGLIGPYIFIKRYSKNYFLSLIIYIGFNFLTMQYFIIRQSIAMTILFFAMKYIENKKILPFTCLILIATLFHSSAIIFVLVYVLTNVKLNKFVYIIICISYAMAYIFKDYIAILVREEFSYNVITSGGKTLLIILIIVYAIICFLNHLCINNYDDNDRRKEKILNSMYILAIFFQLLTIGTNIMARLVTYFSIAMVPMLPNSIEKLSNKNIKYLFTFVLILLIVVYNLFLSEFELYVPFFLNK